MGGGILDRATGLAVRRVKLGMRRRSRRIGFDRRRVGGGGVSIRALSAGPSIGRIAVRRMMTERERGS